jgi:SAM-dependent methyltransferase
MVDALYNKLAKFEGLFRYKAYPVHKRLEFGMQGGFEDLDDWLGKNVQLNKNSKILDAGCGNGHSLFKLVEKYSCRGIGISLSPVEIKNAIAFAQKKNLVQNCQLIVHNFEITLAQKFDLIYGIESIKHAQNIDKVLTNFADQLNPESTLIIVEDFKTKEISNKEYQSFLENIWVAKTLRENDIVSIASQNKLELVDSIDFTGFIKKFPVNKIKGKIKRLKILRQIIPLKKLSEIIDVFIAGYMLDYSYALDEMSYKALILKKSI